MFAVGLWVNARGQREGNSRRARAGGDARIRNRPRLVVSRAHERVIGRGRLIERVLGEPVCRVMWLRAPVGIKGQRMRMHRDFVGRRAFRFDAGLRRALGRRRNDRSKEAAKAAMLSSIAIRFILFSSFRAPDRLRQAAATRLNRNPHAHRRRPSMNPVRTSRISCSATQAAEAARFSVSCTGHRSNAAGWNTLEYAQPLALYAFRQALRIAQQSAPPSRCQ